MKIVITGGSGFIGSQLAAALAATKHEIVTLDMYHNAMTGIRSILGDFTNYNDCLRAFQDADVVFHLGAKTRILNSNKIPDEYYKTNVLGTMNVVKAAIASNVKRIVYTGSSTAYGEMSEDEMAAEDDPTDPLNWYAVTKLMGESIIRTYPNAPEFIIARLFTVYGDGQPTDDEQALVFGKFLNAKKADQLLPIHGDGSQTRDFVDVRDVVSALQLMADCEHVNQVYNVGSGRAVSIKYLATLFEQDVMYATPRQGYASNTLANIFKIYHHLKWYPQYQLEDGVKRMLGEIGDAQ